MTASPRPSLGTCLRPSARQTGRPGSRSSPRSRQILSTRLGRAYARVRSRMAGRDSVFGSVPDRCHSSDDSSAARRSGLATMLCHGLPARSGRMNCLSASQSVCVRLALQVARHPAQQPTTTCAQMAQVAIQPILCAHCSDTDPACSRCRS